VGPELPPPELPPKVAAYRADFRREEIGAGYRDWTGWLHLGVITAGVAVGIAVLASRLEHVGAIELLALPGGYVFANVVEYVVHRWLMHVPRGALRRMYKRHTGQHHRFFTDRAMTTDSGRDFAIILFPPFVVVFFLGLIATPVAAVLTWLVGLDAGLLFGIVALSYFLFYEWMHLASHLPPDGLLGRLPGVRFVREHHRVHHDPRRMRHYNFNITVPLTDWMLGTLWRG
jgi:hypothetical protein